MKRVILLFILSFILTPNSILCQTKANNLTFKDSFLWSEIIDVSADSQYVFCLYRHGLEIYDVSDITTPTFVSKLSIQGQGRNLQLQGEYLFVSTGTGGLLKISIVDKYNPVVVYKYDQYISGAIIIEDSVICMATDSSGLVIINDNTHETIFTYDIEISWDKPLRIFNNRLFILCESNLCIFDIEDLDHISLLNTLYQLEDLDIANDFVIDDNMLYYITRKEVFSQQAYLYIVNISNPDNYNQTHVYVLPNAGYYLQRIDSDFFLATANTLYHIDISDPDTLGLIKEIELNGYTNSIFYYNENFFVAHTYGMDIIYSNLIDTFNMQSSILDSTVVLDIIVDNDIAYVACSDKGAKILNINNTSDIIELSIIDSILCTDLYKMDNTLILSYDRGYGIYFYDINDVTNPKFISAYHSDLKAKVLSIQDNLMACMLSNDEMHFVDVSSPENLTHLSSITGEISACEIYDTVVFYYEQDSDSLKVLNIADIYNPKQISSLKLNAYRTVDMVYNEPYLYTARNQSNNGMYIIDFSTLSDPVVIGTTDEIAYSNLYLHVDYLFAFTSSYFNRVDYYDLTVSSNPFKIETIPTSSLPYGLFIKENLVYIADIDGILVYEIGTATSVADEPELILPDNLVLYQNYPNPFNPTTAIEFSLPMKSNVRLIVYNIRGQVVKELCSNEFSAGSHIVIWDGTNNIGNHVSTGIYFYKLIVGDMVSSKKMLLLK